MVAYFPCLHEKEKERKKDLVRLALAMCPPITLSISSWHLVWRSWWIVMKHTNQSNVIRVVSTPALN